MLSFQWTDHRRPDPAVCHEPQREPQLIRAEKTPSDVGSGVTLKATGSIWIVLGDNANDVQIITNLGLCD